MRSAIHRGAVLVCGIIVMLALPLHARAVREQMLVQPER